MPPNTYQIQPGDNLSTIAQNNNTTVQALMAANQGNTSAIPNQSNPNLILSGGSLNLPGIQPSSAVASSTPAATATNTALGNLNNYQNTPAPNVQTPSSNSGLNLNDIVGDDEQGYYEAQTQLIDNQYQGFINSLNAYQTSNDNITNNLIQNIQQRFELNRQNQQKTNKALEAGTFIAGGRSGRMRYATEMQDSLIASEVSAGLQRMAALDVEENSAIIEALQAKSNRDYDILVKKMDAADKAREDKRTVLLDIYDLAMQTEQIANQKTQNMMDNLDLERGQLTDVAYAIMGDYENADDPEAFINDYASQYGINPVTLRGVMEQVKAEQFNAQPALVQEYEYASQNGFSGSFMDYQRTVEAISNAVDNPTTLTASEAQALGLPQTLVGQTDAAIIQSFNSPNPPSWFDGGFSTGDGGAPTTEALQSAWNQYRQQYSAALQTFSQFRSGLTANQAFNQDEEDSSDIESLFGPSTSSTTTTTTSTETKKERRKRQRAERKANR